jgi:hypothetical protein
MIYFTALLQNATFKKHWKVCVKETSPLMSYSNLIFALDPRSRMHRSRKTLIIPHR